MGRRTLGSERHRYAIIACDPISSEFTRWRVGVLNKSMDAVAELGRNPVSKHQI